MENLRLERRNDTLLVHYEGEITIEVTCDMKGLIEQALEVAPVRAMVMDLSRVTFMDSSGIGFLVSLNTRVQNSGKAFLLFRPSPQVKKTLELVQLIRFFEITENESWLAGPTAKPDR